MQDPDAQMKGYHPVLPRDPEGGIPWLTVRPEPAEAFVLLSGMCWCDGVCERRQREMWAGAIFDGTASCMLYWPRHSTVFCNCS